MKHYVWFGCLGLGSLAAYVAVYFPVISVLAIILLIIAAKGILLDIL